MVERTCVAFLRTSYFGSRSGSWWPCSSPLCPERPANRHQLLDNLAFTHRAVVHRRSWRTCSWLDASESIPFPKRLCLIEPAQSGPQQVEINLRIASQCEITDTLRLSEDAVVLRNDQPQRPNFGDLPGSKFTLGLSRRGPAVGRSVQSIITRGRGLNVFVRPPITVLPCHSLRRACASSLSPPLER